MSPKKARQIYLVVKGRQPGLYREWFGTGGAQEQVQEFPKAVYKGFYTLEEGLNWLRGFDPASLPVPLRQALEQAGAPQVEQENPAELLRQGKVVLFTDGGALTNPGPGGYGVVLRYKAQRREISGGFRLTTNNRMELMACIEGLSALKEPLDTVLFSDSSYVVEGIRKGWAKRWQAHGWMRTRRGSPETEKAKNSDLWERLLALCVERPVEFRWVRGHTGNPDNERCDWLARRAAQRKNLPPDESFEMSAGVFW